MSIERQYYLHCDGDDCQWDDGDSTLLSPDAGSILIKFQRKDAKACGWKVSQPGGTDYCPECWAKMKDVTNEN